MSFSPHATPNDTKDSGLQDASAKTVRSLVERVVAELHEGLRHGHFELTVSCVRVSGHLQVIVSGGRSHRFLIPTKPAQK
jgi:hypothetical protein